LTVIAMTIVGAVVHHYNAPLMEARAKWPRKDTKPFDKVFLAIYMPIVFIHPMVAGLDAVRYHWSSTPFAFVYVGAILFALAMVLIAWVMMVNPFAETSVRIQTDRGHTVVTSGPYRIVRHPMYLGAILMYTATSLVWGSVWALVLAALIAGLMIWRTSREDQTLRQSLPATKNTPLARAIVCCQDCGELECERISANPEHRGLNVRTEAEMGT